MKAINYFDESGNLVFYMYLVDDPRECTMTLNFSIDRSLISTNNTERYIRCIEERLVKDDLRQYFVEKLFNSINKECPMCKVQETVQIKG